MKIRDFLTEQWMDDYERQAEFNMTDTCAMEMTVSDLQKLEPGLLDDLVLDYGWITGEPALRREILSLYQDQREDTLTLTSGALQACQLVMDVLLEPGDHVITIRPGYQLFSDYPRFLGCSASEVELNPEDWSLDLRNIEKEISDRTRMIALASPSNPTGTWLDENQTRQLVDLCRKYDLWLLLDGAYCEFGEDEVHVSDLYDKGISISSLSKFFGLPGLRTGWVKADPEVIRQVNVLRDYTMISTGPVTERLAWAALRHKEEILTRNKKRVAKNRKIIEDWLQRSSCCSCILPDKGTVAFLKIPEELSSRQFALDLLEDTGIFFVPGSCFECEGYFRLGLGREYRDLDAILDQLESYTLDYLASGRGRRPDLD